MATCCCSWRAVEGPVKPVTWRAPGPRLATKSPGRLHPPVQARAGRSPPHWTRLAAREVKHDGFRILARKQGEQVRSGAAAAHTSSASH
jgi:ATP-dependent DNA ligase